MEKSYKSATTTCRSQPILCAEIPSFVGSTFIFSSARQICYMKIKLLIKNHLFLEIPFAVSQTFCWSDTVFYFCWLDPINGLCFRPKFQGRSPQFIWPEIWYVYVPTWNRILKFPLILSQKLLRWTEIGCSFGLGFHPKRRPSTTVASGQRQRMSHPGKSKGFRFGFYRGLNALPKDD